MRSFLLAFLAAGFILSTNVYAGEHAKHEPPKEVNNCIGSGPQAPRNIDLKSGSNKDIFVVAPSIENMQLCNVHFHRNAEHKAAAYSTFVEDGENSGWACQEPKAHHGHSEHGSHHEGCANISEGDTIEIHWVHTTCDINAEGAVPAGTGLNACLTTTCANPQLRVVAQVFVVEKGGKVKFTEATPAASRENSVVYTGSTTGPKFSNNHCSPFQVTWEVKPTCDTMDIDTINAWCSDNKYGENHAHGVRALVTPEALLSPIK